jgi:hypothetical protein
MTISVYQAKIGALGENRGLIIADDENMISISKTENTEQIRTRLFMNGKNNAVITKYNPTGQRYVDDFSYYHNDIYMSKGLQVSLIKYNELVASKEGLFTSYVDRLDAGDQSVLVLIKELQEELLWENNFTKEEIAELVPFVKEETKTVSQISDEKQLYEYALKHLKTIAFIPVQISVDLLDVFSLE